MVKMFTWNVFQNFQHSVETIASFSEVGKLRNNLPFRKKQRALFYLDEAGHRLAKGRARRSESMKSYCQQWQGL